MSRRRRARLTVFLTVLTAVVLSIAIFVVKIPTVADAGSLPSPEGADTQLPAPSQSKSQSQSQHTRTPAKTTADSYSVVVDKRRPLVPRDFVPPDLVAVNVPYIGQRPLLRRAPAAEVQAMFTAFYSETGLHMQSNSAYRSYAEQEAEFRRFSQTLGQSQAAETTARPGYSEHQTGLAIDIGAKGSSCISRACFATTTQARWLAINAWRFGFIIRYPLGQQAVTGYDYEPWHLRFVGKELAKKIHGHFSSLEAYFHLPAAPDY